MSNKGNHYIRVGKRNEDFIPEDPQLRITEFDGIDGLSFSQIQDVKGEIEEIEEDKSAPKKKSQP